MTSGELELTDYRRTVSELYAAVRAEDDPKQAHELWRQGRDELFRSHPQSPLPPGDPMRATGVPYWPYDPELRFELPLLPAAEELTLDLPTSEGVTTMDRVGCLRLPPPLDALNPCDVCADGRRGTKASSTAATIASPAPTQSTLASTLRSSARTEKRDA